MPTREFKIGDVVVVSSAPGGPALARILVFTDEPGKIVGLTMADKGKGLHTCDGRCPSGQGLWATPDEIFTEKEWKARLAAVAPPANEFGALKLAPNAQGHIEARLDKPRAEKQTITADDVGKLNDVLGDQPT